MKALPILLVLLSSVITSCKVTDKRSDTDANIHYESRWKIRDFKVCWESNTLAYKDEFHSMLEKHILDQVPKYVNVTFNTNWPICPSSGYNIRIGNSNLNKDSFDQFGKLSSLVGGQTRLGSAVDGLRSGVEMDFANSIKYHIDQFGVSRTEMQKIVKKNFLHEVFHVLGANHEDVRGDEEISDICDTSVYRTAQNGDKWYSQTSVLIGRPDRNSIVKNCLSDTLVLSSVDIFAMGIIFDYPKTQEFKQRMRSVAMNEIIRLVPERFPLSFDTTSERYKMIYGPKGDLVLWLQMWLSLDENINYLNPSMKFDSQMVNALDQYRSVYKINDGYRGRPYLTADVWNHMKTNYDWRVNSSIRSRYTQDDLLSENIPKSFDDINKAEIGFEKAQNGESFVYSDFASEGGYKLKVNNLPKDTFAVVSVSNSKFGGSLSLVGMIEKTDVTNATNGHWYTFPLKLGAPFNGQNIYKAVDKSMRVLATASRWNGVKQFRVSASKVSPAPATFANSGSSSSSSYVPEFIPNQGMPPSFKIKFTGDPHQKTHFINLPSDVQTIDIFIGTAHLMSLKRYELVRNGSNILTYNQPIGLRNFKVAYKFFTGGIDPREIGSTSLLVSQNIVSSLTPYMSTGTSTGSGSTYTPNSGSYSGSSNTGSTSTLGGSTSTSYSTGSTSSSSSVTNLGSASRRSAYSIPSNLIVSSIGTGIYRFKFSNLPSTVKKIGVHYGGSSFQFKQYSDRDLNYENESYVTSNGLGFASSTKLDFYFYDSAGDFMGVKNLTL